MIDDDLSESVGELNDVGPLTIGLLLLLVLLFNLEARVVGVPSGLWGSMERDPGRMPSDGSHKFQARQLQRINR